ncbi:nucleotidyltransferase domain-containing protein [Faecalicoccus pleomorphus]|uniref:nucleotidyltransferase domain-containing protein n=1 Tax=Faecalicoccus pleomorphus TaxID=1323 RepID=UPI0025A3EEA3|nr:nucleotidyltransferase [Faecalicoccus pleomorphus]MDM8292061.1 nucleotidyltransferase [Faecalicoccus pleomorphus]
MNEKEMQLDELLKYISEEIGITQNMVDMAVKSYESVGSWLSSGIDYDVHIYPQGSMALGTTIKPITDTDDYDIDLVCLLENGQSLDAKAIKNIVGDRLKENGTYCSKIQQEGEGKRCWKMQYNEFHMDILPSVPKTIYLKPNFTDIRLTHKNDQGIYEDRYSNPYGYKKWFENQMGEILTDHKRAYALSNQKEIEDVPTYRVKTPLQISIQLLKRHRDIMFKNDDNAPISIIITTLAALSYCGESSIYETLNNVLNSMIRYVEVKNGVYWIKNPVMPEENFADKWQEHPERKDAFMAWIKQAKKDFIENPLSSLGIDEISTLFENSLGTYPVQRAIKKYANNTRKIREQGKLYTTSTSGVTMIAKGAKKIKGHNFFGVK